MGQRTFNVGLLTEARRRRKDLRVEIDVIVGAITDHFAPRDRDCAYVEKIQSERLRIYVADIARKLRELAKVVAEVARLEEELGNGGVE